MTFQKIISNRSFQHLLFWVSYLAYNTLYLGFLTNAFGYQFFQYGTALPFVICVTYLNLYILLPRFLLNKRWVEYLLWIILLLCGMAILIQTILNVLVNANICPENYFPFGILNPKPLLQRIVQGATVVVFTTGLKLFKIWFTDRENVTNLEKANISNQLQLLKSKIQPHFLFNTLNNLYSLAIMKSDKTPQLIEKLSQIFSFIVYESNDSLIPFRKEMALIENYIDIEKLRTSYPVSITLSVHEDLFQVFVPPFIFLPFVENIFKHGPQGKSIEAVMEWEIADNKIQFTSTNKFDIPLQILPKGIGLETLKKRLDLLYPNCYCLEAKPDGNSFIATLKIPFHETHHSAN